MKLGQVRELRDFLEREGYDTFEYKGGCFDLAARKNRLLLLKVLTNIDSFQKGQARDMKLLSRLLDSSCFLVGKRTRKDSLQDDVVYERFGVPAMTPGTLISTLKEDYPTKLRTRGGFFGEISPEKLRELRREANMTQVELADKVGISQKSISEHESGKKRVFYEKVEALSEVFSEEVKEPINPFEMAEREVSGNATKSRISKLFEDIGLHTHTVRRAPPELIVRSESTLLSKSRHGKRNIDEERLYRFSEISRSDAFLITDDKDRSKKLPCITKEDLEEIEGREELLKILEERKPSA